MDKLDKKGENNPVSGTRFEEIADFTERVAKTDVISDSGYESEEDVSLGREIQDEEVSGFEDISASSVVLDDFGKGPIDLDSNTEIDLELLSTEIDKITQVEKPDKEERDEEVDVDSVEDAEIGIPEELRTKLQDLPIKDVGDIDLRGAEAIASEGVLLLTEDDLIEELEYLDQSMVKPEAATKKEEDTSLPEKEVSEEEQTVVEQVYKEEDEDRPDEMSVVISEEGSIERGGIEEIDSSKIETGEGEKFDTGVDAISPGEAEPDTVSISVEQGSDSVQEQESEGMQMEESDEHLSETPVVKEIIDEMALDSEEGVFIEDDIGEIVDGEEFEDEADLIKDEMDEGDIYIKKIAESDVEDFDYSEGEDKEEMIRSVDVVQDEENISISGEIEFDEDEIVPDERAEGKKVTSIVKEKIPSGLVEPDEGDDTVFIIDDEIVGKEDIERSERFEESELARISTDIVESVESRAKFLREASVDEDQISIAPVMRGAEPTFEDLLVDSQEEYTYSDDELNFIDNKIAGEDFDKSGKRIHDRDEHEAGKISHAIEFLGLTLDEMDLIENNIYSKEYENLDIDAVTRETGIGLDGAASDLISLRAYHYSIPRDDSLLDDEKRSIEEDLISKNAFIFEENVDDIKKKLERLIIKEEEQSRERLPDISNKIVILDDESDVDRFVKLFPEDKHRDMKKLLMYLDGLFEKLPEDVVENFSKSEYFNLYMKVLDDLGI